MDESYSIDKIESNKVVSDRTKCRRPAMNATFLLSNHEAQSHRGSSRSPLIWRFAASRAHTASKKSSSTIVALDIKQQRILSSPRSIASLRIAIF